MVKKNEVIDVLIEDLEFPNKGVGVMGEDIIFVKNTVPRQTVRVTVRKRKGKYEGTLLDTLKKAPYEIEDGCGVFGVCGGCTYQNISYDKELELKGGSVLKLIKKSGIDNFEFLGITGSPAISGYRNKMEFSFGDNGKGGELSLGMRKRNSYYEVVDAGCCNIVDSDISDILTAVLSFFKDHNETFYHKKRQMGHLRHLIVRKAFFTGEILINLVTASSSAKYNMDDFTELLIKLKLEGEISGILHTVNDSLADVVRVDDFKILYGNDYFFEELLGLKFKISSFSFFQTNSAGAEVLYSTVRGFAGDCSDKIVFDLYCGTGTITQLLSEHAKKAIGIEIVPEAVVAARENAVLNNISNCEFIAGDVLNVVPTLEDIPDIIIVDPPRSGIHPKAVGKIISFGAPKIVYVSCNPSTLVNDLNVFAQGGYDVKKIKIVDLFPRTYHVETVVLMQRKDCL